MNLVMIPFHDWRKCLREGFRTRDAHLMEEFACHPNVNKLLVVNRPLSLCEMVLLRRSRTTPGATIIAKQGNSFLSKAQDNVYILDILIHELLLPVKLRRYWTPHAMGTKTVSDSVRWAVDYLQMDKGPWSFLISQPLFAPLFKNNPEWPFSIDADDNLLLQALYRNTPNLQDYYNYCLDHADAVSTNSKANRDTFLPRRNGVLWVPNGVDTRRFNTKTSYARPADMKGISRPIVGYAGQMQEMVDVQGTLRMIRAFPEISFVFIGRILNTAWVAPFWKEPNAYYLGDKQYDDLPSYLAAFDICIIPYSQERQHGGDPIKFYEYLAMGKPVITTNIGNVGKFRGFPQVRIVDTVCEFINPLSQFLGRLNQKKPVPTQAVPVDCEWKTKADILLSNIERGLAERSWPATAQEKT